MCTAACACAHIPYRTRTRTQLGWQRSSQQQQQPTATTMGVLRQFAAVTDMRFRLLLRSWRGTVFLLLAPILFCFLCFVLQLWYDALANEIKPDPPILSVNSIPKCKAWNGVPCITLGYTPPGVQWVEQILDVIANQSSLVRGVDIRSFPNYGIMHNHTLSNPNTTQAAISFDCDFQNNITVPKHISYNLLVNLTSLDSDVTANVQVALDNAVMYLYALQHNPNRPPASERVLHAAFGGYPEVKRRDVSHGDVVAATGSLWFYCSTMFSFIFLLNGIVHEKEHKLRQGMYTMGLSRAVYWLSWLLLIAVINALSSLILIGAGAAFQFDLFLNTNVGVSFVVFFTFATAMVPIAEFASVFISKVKTANTAAFVIFIVGFMFQSFLSNFGITLVYDPSTTPVIRQIFRFYPPFNFAKILSDMATLAYPRFDSNTGTFVPGPGFHWGDLYHRIDYSLAGFSVPPPALALYFLLMNTAIFLVLAFFFDNVLPDQGGTRRPLYFLFSPSYWGCTNCCGRRKKQQQQRQPSGSDSVPLLFPSEYQDSDVQAEAQLCVKDDTSPVRLINLSKTYTFFPCCASKRDVHALKPIYLTVAKDCVMSLLGHNGAGKTTAFNILTGVHKPTTGDAIVYGYSVVDEMDSVRRITGVCPQHDILWEDLTAREHLKLFAGIKGVRSSDTDVAVINGLDDVHLLPNADSRAGTFSGGMKRRLSVAIAAMGDPQVIFLDEPTTGLDPVSRREVWDIIENLKKGRTIILTTHSMEEADLLSDRIAILAEGTLRAIGNPLHLKAKFGSGYSITLVSDPQHTQKVLDVVAEYMPSASLVSNNAGSVTFSLPLDRLAEIPMLFDFIEGSSSREFIRDWGLSHTPLEEVFLRVTRNQVPQQKKSRALSVSSHATLTSSSASINYQSS